MALACVSDLDPCWMRMTMNAKILAILPDSEPTDKGVMVMVLVCGVRVYPPGSLCGVVLIFNLSTEEKGGTCEGDSW